MMWKVIGIIAIADWTIRFVYNVTDLIRFKVSANYRERVADNLELAAAIATAMNEEEEDEG